MANGVWKGVYPLVLGRSLTTCNACKIQNGRQGAPKWRIGLEICLPLDFGCSKQLSRNKFFDPSTPSMRNVDDGGKKKKEKRMTFLVATNVIASRLPERRLTGTPHARANLRFTILNVE